MTLAGPRHQLPALSSIALVATSDSMKHKRLPIFKAHAAIDRQSMGVISQDMKERHFTASVDISSQDVHQARRVALSSMA